MRKFQSTVTGHKSLEAQASRSLSTARRGYTIVEMLVVIAVATIVLALITDSILSFYRSNTSTFEQAVQVDEARRGVDRLVRDLREVAYADTGNFPLATISTTSISFYSDVDRDYSAELVRYYLSGTVLRKGIINATGTPPAYNPADEQITVISQYVRNGLQSLPIFRYYNASSTEIAAGTGTTSIKYIRIDLVVNVDPNRLPGEFTLRSNAALRNLK
jgi:prepilin-type N-terminal cleavage/methylation domain-containing protein